MAKKKTLVLRPYCPFCGSIKPADIKSSICIPCANQGHSYRLVENESDRLNRIRVWAKFYSDHEYSKSDVDSIYWFNKHLLGRTFSKMTILKENPTGEKENENG